MYSQSNKASRRAASAIRRQIYWASVLQVKQSKPKCHISNRETNLLSQCSVFQAKQAEEPHQESGDESTEPVYCNSNKANRRATLAIGRRIYQASVLYCKSNKANERATSAIGRRINRASVLSSKQSKQKSHISNRETLGDVVLAKIQNLFIANLWIFIMLLRYFMHKSTLQVNKLILTAWCRVVATFANQVPLRAARRMLAHETGSDLTRAPVQPGCNFKIILFELELTLLIRRNRHLHFIGNT